MKVGENIEQMLYLNIGQEIDGSMVSDYYRPAYHPPQYSAEELE